MERVGVPLLLRKVEFKKNKVLANAALPSLPRTADDTLSLQQRHAPRGTTCALFHQSIEEINLH